MPFKSKAQAKKMAILEKKGEVKKGTWRKWEKETEDMDDLPMKKKPAKKRKGK